MDALDTPTHIWCVSNPVGGGGRGRQLTEALVTLLRRRFPDLEVHQGPGGACSSSTNLGDNQSVAVSCPSEEVPAIDQAPIPPLPSSSSTCNVHYTGCIGDGSRIAQEVVSARILGLLGTGMDESTRRHFVVVVGGDGTLSEVIDGLCRGLLEDPKAPRACCAFTASSQRREAAQQRLGRLPTIVYLAGGTGADFARLGYCCKTPEEVFSIVTSARLEALAGMTPTDSNATEGCARPTAEVAGKSTGSRVRVPTYAKVDVGAVAFLNPIESPAAVEPAASSSSPFRHQYFINEVSVGLSSAVVQRAEKLKSSCLSFFGGSAVFLGAGAIELLRMTPRPIRMRQVMDLDEPSNCHSTSCTNYTPPPPATQQQQLPSTTAIEQSERWSEGAWVSLASTALVFGNGQYFGGGMKVCPQSNLFDQRLSITSWGESTCGFLFGFPSIYTGRASQSWRSSRMFTGQRVVVEVDSSAVSRGVSQADADRLEEFALMEADGEPLSRLPALVETCLGIRFAFLR